MTYKLLENSTASVVDNSPILLDLKDTFKVSFIIPDGDGLYIALFTDSNGSEYKVAIRDGFAAIPAALLNKAQKIAVAVVLTDGEKIMRSWICQPLKIGCFLQMRQQRREVTVDTSEQTFLEEIAFLKGENERLSDFVEKLSASLAEIKATLETRMLALEKQNEIIL